MVRRKSKNFVPILVNTRHTPRIQQTVHDQNNLRRSSTEFPCSLMVATLERQSLIAAGADPCKSLTLKKLKTCKYMISNNDDGVTWYCRKNVRKSPNHPKSTGVHQYQPSRLELHALQILSIPLPISCLFHVYLIWIIMV